ncbi:MAG: 2-dehydropantoate 2-reductase N-terminal domain-containing protein [Methanomassiliicoccus sp.]|nr:2-dehydropantoate 2-reductase N-terminal domain-containing protein [Methanomassiliicoccus sp.]
MKVLIVGAGIIGITYGWALDRAGHDITHIVRKGRIGRLDNGIAIDMLDTRQGRDKRIIDRYAIRAIDELDSSIHYDMVIVPVHHYDLIETLEQYVPFLNGSLFILLTQNWHGTSEIDHILPRDRYVFGDAKAGGSFINDVLVTAIRTVDIGRVGKGSSNCLDKATELFASADLEPKSHEDILQYLWIQYAVAAGMWPPVVRMGSIEAVTKDLPESKQAFKGAKECLNVVSMRGVDLDGYPETKMFGGNMVMDDGEISTMMSSFVDDEYSKRSSSHALNNVREVSTFYYDLLNTGRELGADMSTMASYADDIKRFCEGQRTV